MATTAAAAAKVPAEAAPEAAPKKKSKLLLIIIIVVVALLAGAGAGAWYFMSNGDADEDEGPKASAKPAVFLPVDQFTVNLQPEDGQQFLQVAMTLKLVDQPVADAIKAQLPEVRSRVLLLLSSKKPSQLISLEGKAKLAAEIAHEVEAPLPVDKSKALKTAKDNAKAKGDTETKSAKKAKGKAKSRTKDGEEDKSAPPRVLAVFFTHFIVQ